ncbi:metalloendopeptidase ASCRUDRAFT_35637 [Ascoidea rubescens DSM 1968]|uniref:Peptidase M48 domain-containing protein n=1 Tax=Ascoidea rubescens DSM 1968 TaxID=1344418 RepID=A0A1D2VFA4_9ASCO|nr:hypothetical protein ASCRUDRAFT_35637 [Ascoidea rubescens DSM 1968]ODV60305.1 hypothetical protein ASCRUDRAFT_35637 [Ascoidea rubescens DSM 1968]
MFRFGPNLNFSLSSRVLNNTFNRNPNPSFSRFDSQFRFYATYKRFNNQKNSTGFSLEFFKDPKIQKRILVGGALFAAFYVYNLDQAPISNRRRCIWIPKFVELKLADITYRQILHLYDGKFLPDNHPYTRKIESIMKKIIKGIVRDENGEAKEIDWKVHVIHDPNVPPNAFVLPGGKIFVFTTIFPIAKNDDGLATILSHETAHQLARHTSENLSKKPLYSLLGIILYTITGSSFINDLFLKSIFLMPASREMETEADYIGLMIMSEGCFKIDEALKFWKRFKEFEDRSGVRSFEFLETHPASETRYGNIERWLPEARERQESVGCYSNQFLNFSSFNHGFDSFF